MTTIECFLVFVFFLLNTGSKANVVCFLLVSGHLVVTATHGLLERSATFLRPDGIAL